MISMPLPFRKHLTYLPAQSPLAAAVPGDEEDYPCISRGSVIRNQSIGSTCGVSMEEVRLRIAFAILENLQLVVLTSYTLFRSCIS